MVCYTLRVGQQLFIIDTQCLLQTQVLLPSEKIGSWDIKAAKKTALSYGTALKIKVKCRLISTEGDIVNLVYEAEVSPANAANGRRLSPSPLSTWQQLAAVAKDVDRAEDGTHVLACMNANTLSAYLPEECTDTLALPARLPPQSSSLATSTQVASSALSVRCPLPGPPPQRHRAANLTGTASAGRAAFQEPLKQLNIHLH
ncbi:uncharacterized protein V6R79_010926 [Siganus canaliculatus]